MPGRTPEQEEALKNVFTEALTGGDGAGQTNEPTPDAGAVAVTVPAPPPPPPPQPPTPAAATPVPANTPPQKPAPPKGWFGGKRYVPPKKVFGSLKHAFVPPSRTWRLVSEAELLEIKNKARSGVPLANIAVMHGLSEACLRRSYGTVIQKQQTIGVGEIMIAFHEQVLAGNMAAIKMAYDQRVMPEIERLKNAGKIVEAPLEVNFGTAMKIKNQESKKEIVMVENLRGDKPTEEKRLTHAPPWNRRQPIAVDDVKAEPPAEVMVLPASSATENMPAPAEPVTMPPPPATQQTG